MFCRGQAIHISGGLLVRTRPVRLGKAVDHRQNHVQTTCTEGTGNVECGPADTGRSCDILHIPQEACATELSQQR